ncbi:MAG: hypothetical protein A2Y17_11285 [Clostridiales bacterium GWF2_38_85]|nr:MAG: hypothetical protein A2Y17_11285 [Clostridiales bacterium GWF2_38_85]
MKIDYNVTGKERKSLVAAISQELNSPIKYLGMPTMAYEVGGYHIDKNGIVAGKDNKELIADLQGLHSFVAVNEEYDEDWAEHKMHLINLESQNIPDYSNRGQYGGDIQQFENLQLTEREELGLGRERHEDFHGENGMRADDILEPESRTFQAELSDPGYPDRMEIFNAYNDEDAIRQAYEFCEGEILLLELFEMDDDYNRIRSVEITPRPDRLTIEIPLDGFTQEKIDNLNKLVSAKAPLLKAALGTDDLMIKQSSDTLMFPWFRGNLDAEHVQAYSALVSFLCKTAIEKNRITAKEKDTKVNPKYAMRCFLLSIGFIGDEYKTARKILLSKLEGNSSRKNGKRTEVADDEFSD